MMLKTKHGSDKKCKNVDNNNNIHMMPIMSANLKCNAHFGG